MSITKLDADCSNKIRRSQVITKISDVVRELVDNAIDANAHSVQILLDNYGLKKIEVKDNGHGIPHEDMYSLFQGGYTSKLHSDSHLSCDDKYGFRGEALSAICSFSGIVVTSKRQTDPAAKNFVLSKDGTVTSEKVVPCGNGTVFVVRDLFKDFPVRNKHSSEPKVAKTQLKDIEFYLKCLGICNPSIYFSLYHNGNLIWSKPAVKNTEQALTTVLGVGFAKNLSSCLSAEVFPDGNEKSWKGSLNLFVPQKPVDMKNMGFTSSKMTMIFVNRRLVVVDEYQNLIKRYAIGSADRPTQQEQRKFPLSVFMIDVPPSEVDFNRDMDKSKMFLTCREVILSRLEGMLQSYYGVNLSELGADDLVSDSEEINANTTSELRGESLNNGSSVESVAAVDKTVEKGSVQLIGLSMSTPEKRKENIAAFLHGSSNFLNPTTRQVSAESVLESSAGTAKMNERIIPLSDFTISFDDLMDSQDTFGKVYDRGQVDAEKENTNVYKVSLESSVTKEPFGSPGNASRALAVPDATVTTDAWVPSTSSPASFPGLPKPFEEVEQVPQCGAVLHNAAISDSNLGERLSLRRMPVFTPFSKRPRPSDSFDDTLPPKTPEPAVKKSRQVTLEDLRRRDSPKPFRKVSTGTPCRLLEPMEGSSVRRLLDSDSEPVLTKQNQSGTSGERRPSFECNASFTADLNSTSVFGLNSSVNLHEFSAWSNQSGTKSILEEKSSHVIGAIGDTGIFVVKIDGLLGVFNPKKLLEVRPDFNKETHFTNYTDDASMDRISFLVQKFTASIEELDSDSAQAVFYIFSDLEELENSEKMLQ